MIKIVLGEVMNSQMSIVGTEGEFSASPVIKIISGIHLVNRPVATGGYFLWGVAVGDGLQSLAYCRC